MSWLSGIWRPALCRAFKIKPTVDDEAKAWARLDGEARVQALAEPMGVFSKAPTASEPTDEGPRCWHANRWWVQGLLMPMLFVLLGIASLVCTESIVVNALNNSASAANNAAQAARSAAAFARTFFVVAVSTLRARADKRATACTRSN